MNAFSRWFPVPAAIMPPSAGVDISDGSIRWLGLKETAEGLRVATWGEIPLESGIVTRGVIEDPARLSRALAHVKKTSGIECINASLPEESGYVFGMPVPDPMDREQVMNMIGFELEGRVPIAPSAAIFDYDATQKREESGIEIGVVVFPREFVDAYVSAFEAAGMCPMSFELEARSMARAIYRKGDDPVELLVDFGRKRTGFAVLRDGVPIFTSTVDVGGDTMTQAIMEKLGVSEKEASAFKDDHGLLPVPNASNPGLEVISVTAGALSDEIVRHFRYWDTRRNERGDRMTPVGRIVLAGGGANLRGLVDYVAARAQAPVERPNVWRNVCSFDEYIPPIDRASSLQFATVVGLALRSVKQ